jgi:hypothetical protein
MARLLSEVEELFLHPLQISLAHGSCGNKSSLERDEVILVEHREPLPEADNVRLAEELR